jgi:hypothetical protein
MIDKKKIAKENKFYSSIINVPNKTRFDFLYNFRSKHMLACLCESVHYRCPILTKKKTLNLMFR